MPRSNRSKYPLSSVSAAFLEHSPVLKKFLARFFSSQQDIEDVAQEAYLRAYVAEQKKQGIEHPRAFLFRVARNVAMTELTKKSRQITDYLADSRISVVLDTEASAEQESEADEQLGLFCDAVARLPSKCREVFLLRKIHGLPHKEIAARMGLSVSSVEKYLRQGMSVCLPIIDGREELTPTPHRSPNRAAHE